MIKSISLDGKWKLAYSDFNSKKPSKFSVNASVPGEVHLDLIKAGKISDPYYSDNYRKCRWLEEKDWWFKKEFIVPASYADSPNLKLVFEGLDTLATVWLNNKRIGMSDNMFLPAVFEINKQLKFGEKNVLAVKIASTVKTLERWRRGKTEINTVMGPAEQINRIYLRKAQYNFGWDIAPRIVTAGIWKDVKIVAEEKAVISDVFVSTDKISGKTADISVSCAVSSKMPLKNLFITIKISELSGKSIVTLSNKIIKPEMRQKIKLKNVKLWWPAYSGKQNLYKVNVSLIKDDVMLDKKEKVFGIKTVELVQEKQSDKGRSFYFKINGKRIFIRGTNWVPLEGIPSKVTKERIKKAVMLAKDQYVNCVRVWGGGYYEDDHFYDLCDKHGIMVWQDFMFACGIYPQDARFLNKVKKEAEYILKWLRGRACLMLWAGDNEIDANYTWQGFENGEFRKNKINRIIIKNAWKKLDPGTPYIPSSPFSPRDNNPCSQKEGDNHIWRHGIYYAVPAYANDRSRFISEMGHLGVPALSSIKKFIPGKYLWPANNHVWDEHFGSHLTIKVDLKRREKMELAMKSAFGYIPKKMTEYVKLSQKLQADALEFWARTAVNNKYCGGYMYWNLLDGWPQFSDAVVDYYFKKKPAYNAIKKVYKESLKTRDRPWFYND